MMQVTMTMEEYEELTFKNEKVIEELKETYNSEILAMQNRLMLEIRKLRSGKEKLESKINNEGCEFCNGNEETIMYTSDSNSIYIGKGQHGDNSGKICLINSDSYTGNEVGVNYCPMCGKKLEA